jgi:hypothetical protein
MKREPEPGGDTTVAAALLRVGLIIAAGFATVALRRADLGLVIIWVGAVVFLLWTQRMLWLARLGIASVLAALWLLVAHNRYVYNRDFLVVGGANLFTLFAWGTGLFAAYVIFHNLARAGGVRSHWGRYTVFCASYWPLLFTFETVGYNVFNIHDLAVAGHPPLLPIADSMHMPAWMKACYLLMGPVFLASCDIAERFWARARRLWPGRSAGGRDTVSGSAPNP